MAQKTFWGHTNTDSDTNHKRIFKHGRQGLETKKSFFSLEVGWVEVMFNKYVLSSKQTNRWSAIVLSFIYTERKRTGKRFFPLSLFNVNIKLDSLLTFLGTLSLSLSRHYKRTCNTSLRCTTPSLTVLANRDGNSKAYHNFLISEHNRFQVHKLLTLQWM